MRRYVLVFGTHRVRLTPGVWHIGRDPALEIVLAEPTVSRRHATLRVSHDRVELLDAGSRNGVSLNGRRIWQRADLTPGDRIEVGSINLRLRSTRLHSRTAGGAWEGGRDDSLVLPPHVLSVEWYAEAVGPGGVVVATTGDRETPGILRFERASGDERAESRPTDPRDRVTGRRKRWLWIGTGVALVAIGAVVTAVLLTSRSEASGGSIAGPSFGLMP